MRHWLAVVLAVLTGAAPAQSPPATAPSPHFNTLALPQAMTAYRLWLASARGVAASSAAMALVAPGVTLNARNHATYAPKIQPMIEAIGKQLPGADGADTELDAAKRWSAMLAAAEWQALVAGNAAPQAYIDATLAIAMLTSAGVSEQTSPDAARLWQRVRGMVSAYDASGGKARLQAATPAEETAFNKLKAAIDAWVRAQRERSDAAAAKIGRALYPDYASGKARQVGGAAKIEVLIESLSMPQLGRFYATLWGEIQTSEVLLKVHELARATGRPENWDSDGTRRPRMAEFILPRVQKFAADAPTSDGIAALLTELISDADVDWMRAESQGARGQKLMPTVERLIIASFWRRGIEPGRAWPGNTDRTGELAREAIDALRGDPNGRDPIMKRLEAIEQKSGPAFERVLKYQVERTRVAVEQVMKRDDKEIRAYLQSLK